MSAYIIAEAGVNHNGSLAMAKALAKIAKDAGADAVKYQTFKAESLVTKAANQADYQVDNLGEQTSQYEMLKALELSYESFISLKEYCDELGIEFLSTAFDGESLKFLVEQLDVKTLKVPSGELTNYPLLVEMAAYQLPLIISTGMATVEEIHEALSFIVYRLGHSKITPNLQEIERFYKTESAQKLLGKYVTLLHCTTAYPTPMTDVNLNAIDGMREEFQLPIGFSDHSKGVIAAIGATAKGVTVLEKHFTLSKKLEGPDHLASLEPSELKEMIQSIREMEIMLGRKVKEPTAVEIANKEAARKSIVANNEIKKGTQFTAGDLAIKRPGSGLLPKYYWSLIEKEATRDYQKDELIDE